MGNASDLIFNNVWFIASIWIGLALLSSLISVRLGLSVALVEIVVGVIAGNIHFSGAHEVLHSTEWSNFLAMLGSCVLTFLAGAEIDPESLRAHLKASLSIGIAAFLLPFVGVWLFAQYVLGWSLHQAQIAGIALSTTSVAVVYAVMVETRQNETALGKMLLAACFINDLGTVLALGIIFANFNFWLLIFVAVTCVFLWLMPKCTKYVVSRYGATKVSEPEIKFIFFVLFFLGGLATIAKSEAVLPAYVIGLVVAGIFHRDKTLVFRMRSIAFAVFTPFYFIRAGSLVSTKVLITAVGIIVLLLLAKMVTKFISVYPLSRVFYLKNRHAMYTTLLMSTGLTFGTISAYFGLHNKIIDQSQYSILVVVVILSAFVPTLIAQRFFQPSAKEMNDWGKVYMEKSNSKTSNIENK